MCELGSTDSQENPVREIIKTVLILWFPWQAEMLAEDDTALASSAVGASYILNKQTNQTIKRTEPSMDSIEKKQGNTFDLREI